MTRFLHSADWQLGMTRHFLVADAQARFTAARIDAVRAIGDLAQREECPFVVVCGDVFETNHVERQVVVRALDAMGAHPGVVFYLLPGNHDPLDAASVFRSETFLRHRPGNVVVLEDSTPVAAGPGVELVAAPWFSKRPLVDLVARATQGLPTGGTLRVVVGHGAVDTYSPDPHNPAVIVQSALEAGLADRRFHFVALGDRHSTTDVGGTGRIWYSGAPEPTDFTEVDPGNVLVVDLDHHGVRVQPTAVGNWRFVLGEFDVTGSDDCDRVESFLAAIDDKARTIVKLALVGQLSLAEKAHLDEVLEHHQDLLGSLQTWERRSELVVLPDGEDFESLQLTGFAGDALEDLRRAAAGDDEVAVTARDALGILYRLGRATP